MSQKLSQTLSTSSGVQFVFICVSKEISAQISVFTKCVGTAISAKSAISVLPRVIWGEGKHFQIVDVFPKSA